MVELPCNARCDELLLTSLLRGMVWPLKSAGWGNMGTVEPFEWATEGDPGGGVDGVLAADRYKRERGLRHDDLMLRLPSRGV